MGHAARARRLITWANTVLANRSGQIEYVIATGIDITERRQAEDAMKMAQTHLVQAARLTTIGEMASGVAHQINNPLTTIIADAQLLLRQLPLDHPVRESAEAIEQAGWRLQQVVQHLVEFSRPGSAELEDLEVNETIQSALSLVGAHLESVGVALETVLAQGLPNISGSRRQLEDLWVNLLLLARDATHTQSQGKIRIESAAAPQGGVVVRVSDNGDPIPPDRLATIFEPNFIGPTANRGTGMELSICREIVRQLGGQIGAESVSGPITIFSIVFPESQTGGIPPLEDLL